MDDDYDNDSGVSKNPRKSRTATSGRCRTRTTHDQENERKRDEAWCASHRGFVGPSSGPPTRQFPFYAQRIGVRAWKILNGCE